MRGKQITNKELHGVIGVLVKKYPPTEIDWHRQKKPIWRGITLSALHQRAFMSNVPSGKHKKFFGHGTWREYLTNVHGISREDFHSKVSKAIQKADSLSASHWVNGRQVVNGIKLNTLYWGVESEKVGGKPFSGHGSWYNYLKKVHGVVPLDPHKWSDERLHRSIVLLSRRFPAKETSWPHNPEPVLHGKSLRNYHDIALNRKVRGKSFFGHGSFYKYVDWAREHYG